MATERRPKGGPRTRAASVRKRATSVTTRRTPVRKSTKAVKARKAPAVVKRAKAPKAVKVPADVALAVSAALDKKAEQVHVLDLRKGSAFTDFFIIATGNNIRQVQAIADGIEEALRKAGSRAALVEGRTRSEWLLMDYFDFIVHVFTPTTREFYALEKLWGDAEPHVIPDQHEE